MLQKSAQTKNVLRSVDDFLNVVTQLKSVCFTQRRTLFTSKEDSIFKKQANLYGLDLPEKSKIRLDYGATPIGAAKNALRDWKMKRESGEFEDVIVVGMDDNGLESMPQHMQLQLLSLVVLLFCFLLKQRREYFKLLFSAFHLSDLQYMHSISSF